MKTKRLPNECLVDFPLKKATETDTYCYTPTQVKAILARCAQCEKSRWLHRVLMALACTGLRISELASLRWSDVIEQNDGRRTILLKDESTSTAIDNRPRRETKSSRSRSFPVHEDLARVLDTISKSKDGYIFHGPRGGLIKPDTVRNIFVREVIAPLADAFPGDQDGTSFQDGRLHSFRHYFCSQCVDQGVPEQMLMRWLGHRQSRMVQCYYHLHDQESQRQMAQLKLVN